MQKRCFNDAWWLYKWWNILSLQTNASKRRWHIGRVKCYTNPIYHMCRTSNAIIVRSHTNHNIWCFDFAVCTFYAHYHHHHHHLSFCLCVCIGCAHGFCLVLVQIFFSATMWYSLLFQSRNKSPLNSYFGIELPYLFFGLKLTGLNHDP